MMERTRRSGFDQNLGLNLALAALVLVLLIAALMVGPAGLSPRGALAALIGGDGAAGLIVREIRLPRALLAALIGATFGLSGAALQGLLRNPLAEPALFGAPQAAAAGASFVIAFGFVGATSLAVPLAGIAGALLSIGGLVAIAGRRASLTVTLLAGLAFASFAGAATALILNLAPNPYIALEIAYWLLGSLQDRSADHLWLATPFFIASWIVLALSARSFRVLTLGEDAAISLGVHVDRVRLMVVIGAEDRDDPAVVPREGQVEVEAPAGEEQVCIQAHRSHRPRSSASTATETTSSSRLSATAVCGSSWRAT